MTYITTLLRSAIQAEASSGYVQGVDINVPADYTTILQCVPEYLSLLKS